ncbi:RNA polymerase sigma factor SigJ [Streptomyces sp. NPDC048473]|uniref:RNA polymerase sigma factor SigJ n=1 Tax=unclassified Streptomyces TaxID=2593676 RepID=UPI003718102C
MRPGRATPDALGAIIGERRTLINLAHRLLGSATEAEDVVQETYSRWYAMTEAEQHDITSPTGWLVRVAGRICLDQLKSARRSRERYVGDWLPEPLPDRPRWSTSSPEGSTDPADLITLDESVSMGVLVVLEALTPAERVAFVLHDVFGVPFAEIAETVGRTPAACRQLATSARRHIRTAPRNAGDPERHHDTVSAFRLACRSGDLGDLIGLLDPDVIVETDGGGKVRTALRPISGAEKVARFFRGALRKELRVTVSEENVNSSPGLVVRLDGVTIAVIAIEFDGDTMEHFWLMMNPEKLHAWNKIPHQ